MSERLLTPHPCLVPSLSVRNEQCERDGVEEVGRKESNVRLEVTHSEGKVMARVKVNGDVNTVKSKKVEGLDEDEIGLLEELWGRGDRGMD